MTFLWERKLNQRNATKESLEFLLSAFFQLGGRPFIWAPTSSIVKGMSVVIAVSALVAVLVGVLVFSLPTLPQAGSPTTTSVVAPETSSPLQPTDDQPASQPAVAPDLPEPQFTGAIDNYPSISGSLSPSNPSAGQPLTLKVSATDDAGVRTLSWQSSKSFSSGQSGSFDCALQASCTHSWELVANADGGQRLGTEARLTFSQLR